MADQIMFVQMGSELGTLERCSAVGMKYRTVRQVGIGCGHADRVADQVGAAIVGHRPAHNLLGMALAQS